MKDQPDKDQPSEAEKTEGKPTSIAKRKPKTPRKTGPRRVIIDGVEVIKNVPIEDLHLYAKASTWRTSKKISDVQFVRFAVMGLEEALAEVNAAMDVLKMNVARLQEPEGKQK